MTFDVPYAIYLSPCHLSQEVSPGKKENSKKSQSSKNGQTTHPELNFSKESILSQDFATQTCYESQVSLSRVLKFQQERPVSGFKTRQGRNSNVCIFPFA
jgi:hypothetical protein